MDRKLRLAKRVVWEGGESWETSTTLTLPHITVNSVSSVSLNLIDSTLLHYLGIIAIMSFVDDAIKLSCHDSQLISIAPCPVNFMHCIIGAAELNEFNELYRAYNDLWISLLKISSHSTLKATALICPSHQATTAITWHQLHI